MSRARCTMVAGQPCRWSSCWSAAGAAQTCTGSWSAFGVVCWSPPRGTAGLRIRHCCCWGRAEEGAALLVAGKGLRSPCAAAGSPTLCGARMRGERGRGSHSPAAALPALKPHAAPRCHREKAPHKRRFLQPRCLGTVYTEYRLQGAPKSTERGYQRATPCPEVLRDLAGGMEAKHTGYSSTILIPPCTAAVLPAPRALPSHPTLQFSHPLELKSLGRSLRAGRSRAAELPRQLRLLCRVRRGRPEPWSC